MKKGKKDMSGKFYQKLGETPFFERLPLQECRLRQKETTEGATTDLITEESGKVSRVANLYRESAF